ncbi:MAG TPA: flagellar motor switch protein FliN [Solirubrobacteraceae bacterium]|jgi:flagellar motor switch protein FliN/FliY
MSEAVVYEQLDQAGEDASATGLNPETDLRRLSDVPMELSVEIGRAHMTVGETLQLRAGSVITLERLAGEPVDLLVNGTPIARGEVVVVDEQFGLRVSEILEGEHTAAALASESAAVSEDDPAGADAVAQG